MTYEQITDLLNKGFSPDQITALTTSGNMSDPDESIPISHPQEAPEPDPLNPLEDPEPSSDQPAPAPDPEPDHSAEIMSAISDLKKTIQQSNIRTMSVDTISGEDSLERAMSELIRPSFNKEGI